MKRRGMFKETVEAYFGALRLEPDDAEINFALGEVYLTCLYDKKRAFFISREALN
jgi:cytochrome c-type biogenesis protein CcmH/NrfG